MRRLVRFLAPYKVLVILAPLMMALEVTGDLMMPRLVQHIIDEGILVDDRGEVLRSGVLMVVIALVGMVAGVLCGVFAIRASLGFAADLREAQFRTVQQLSFGNLDRLETGSLITRLTTDVTQLSDAVQMAIRIMIRSPLTLLGSLVLGILTAPRLAPLFVVLFPVIAVLIAVVMKKAFPRFRVVQSKLDRINAIIQENLAGVRVVKAFARHDHERRRFGVGNDDLRDTTLGATYIMVAVMPLIMFVVNVGLVAALWFGGVRVIDGDLDLGALVAFTNYLVQSLSGLMMLSMIIVRFTRAEVSAERVNEVLDSVPDLAQPTVTSSQDGPALRGEVSFEHVGFRFSEDSDDVLRDLSFTVRPGQVLAILGATGSGKSALVGLIPRFYDATSGVVRIDGHDVREIPEPTLRHTVAIALQEAVLFSGTIADNIRFGNEYATRQEVERAAEMAQAAEFVRALPEGFDSVVGQRGVNLSGGQRQRLAIARALVQRAQVLVLDDSTSAVDVATEARIQAALATIDQTCIIVAQRISAVIGADRILVLDDGRIVADGTHDELLRGNATYREICLSQFPEGQLPAGPSSLVAGLSDVDEATTDEEDDRVATS
ncbi:ABC transporter ATP-binding protein [Aestuariimicrobium soli]|uniref:ABC transporter ATP-binding protein n=1 Tax=Aestuariimicrobium soli TaxID=2035834 RepID=UPI003EBC2D3D